MRSFISFALAFLIFLSGLAEAQNPGESMIIEKGGTGPFKAIVTSDSTMPNYTIYRPENLSEASKESKIPVILFANGACFNSSKAYINFLSEIASNGYMVIAIGPYIALSDNADMNLIRQPTKSSQLLDALDWITLKNEDQAGIYYQKIRSEKDWSHGPVMRGTSGFGSLLRSKDTHNRYVKQRYFYCVSSCQFELDAEFVKGISRKIACTHYLCFGRYF